jgi:hypothetical protein
VPEVVPACPGFLGASTLSPNLPGIEDRWLLAVSSWAFKCLRTVLVRSQRNPSNTRMSVFLRSTTSVYTCDIVSSVRRIFIRYSRPDGLAICSCVALGFCSLKSRICCARSLASLDVTLRDSDSDFGLDVDTGPEKDGNSIDGVRCVSCGHWGIDDPVTARSNSGYSCRFSPHWIFA